MSPLDLSSYAIEEKNKLATDSIWYVALEITIPGVGPPVRVVRNNENIMWRGETWQAFPFELDEIGEEGKGEVPEVVIRVGNVSRSMEAYLQYYDTYTKQKGFTPITVAIYVLNSRNLASTTPETVHYFELKQPKTNSMWATFTLGAPSPFAKRFPKDRIMKDHCRFIFKSALCGYTGGGLLCDKTLTACRGYSNSERFGGFPGVGSRGLRLV